MKGVNIGGWMSQSDFSAVDSFVTEKDFSEIKKLGFDTVRLPVDSHFFETKPFVFDLSKIEYVDKAIKWAKKHKLKLILDLHKAPGHSFQVDEKEKNDIWFESDSRERFLNIWNFFSQRYKGKGIYFEIMNEAVAPDNKLWMKLLDDAIKTIRKNDKKSQIVVGSNMWNSPKQYKKMKKFKDKNIIYTFHFYEPHVVSHQKAEWMPGFEFIFSDYPGKPTGISEYIKQSSDLKQNLWISEQNKFWNIKELELAMKNALDFAKKNKIKMFCGEFGCIAHVNPITRQNWTKDVVSLLKKHKIGYVYWNYKNMDFGLFDYTSKYGNAGNLNYSNNKDEEVIKILTK